jgi:molybdopterin-guanine dinucleotide biosynthesis protein A
LTLVGFAGGRMLNIYTRPERVNLSLAVLILAGGKSQRFGRRKAFLEINGKPMIQLVVEEMSKLSNDIVISCRSAREKLAKMFPQAKIVTDKYEKRGALTGLV